MIAICRTSVLVILGLVVIAQAENCSIPVAGPNMNLKDKYILLDTFPNAFKVSFECATGYLPAGGSASITCTSGTWSPVKLTCERFNCGPMEIPNGIVDYPEGTLFGDQLVASCNPGYNMLGRSKILCGAKGWLDRAPECEAQVCYPPPALANGGYIPVVDEVYFYSSIISYRCNSGFVLNGSTSRRCSEKGQFEPDAPRCISTADVNCKDPGPLKNGWRSGGFAEPHRYNSDVLHECNSGYVLFGPSSMKCGLDGHWSNGLPECRLQPTTTTTTTTTKATPPISPKEPVAPPDGTTPPNGANHLKWAIPTVLGAIIVAASCIALVVFKKKQGSQRGYSDKNASKDEGVALS